jgi:Mrp family chromosome partitioning ATPase
MKPGAATGLKPAIRPVAAMAAWRDEMSVIIAIAVASGVISATGLAAITIAAYRSAGVVAVAIGVAAGLLLARGLNLSLPLAITVTGMSVTMALVTLVGATIFGGGAARR